MKVKVAAIQMSADIGGREANVERAERLLIQAARQGADLCVLPELALDEFFPLYKDTRYFAYAEELDGPTVRRFRSLAGELGIYLALPLFEKSLIGTYYNSLVLLTPEGTIGAVYRKVRTIFVSKNNQPKKADMLYIDICFHFQITQYGLTLPSFFKEKKSFNKSPLPIIEALPKIVFSNAGS